MEKNYNYRNGTDGKGVDFPPGEAITGKNSEAWGLAKPTLCIDQKSASRQESNSLWSCVDKSGKQDVAWKSIGVNNPHPDGNSEQWSGSLSGTSNVWAGKSESSGWGSPCSSPVKNAGTERWGSATSAQKTWGETRVGSGWKHQDKTFDADWKKLQNAKGDSEDNQTVPVNDLWSHLRTKLVDDVDWQEEKQLSHWGPGSEITASKSSWENGLAVNTKSQPTSTSWSGGGWADNSSVSATVKAPPIPNQSTSATSLPATSTWAQAAGRGLNISNAQKPAGSLPCAATTPSTPSAPRSALSKEDLIAQLVNSKDGWGKTPVRQDTSWDLEEGSSQGSFTSSSSGKVSSSGASSSTSSAAESGSSQISCLSNTGTAIWESLKESNVSSSGKASSIVSMGSKDAVTKDNTVCRKPPNNGRASAWTSLPNESSENVIATSSGNQLPSFELNCDKLSPSGAWHMPESTFSSSSASVTDSPWNVGNKGPVWESSRTLTWSDNSKSSTSSSDILVLDRESGSSFSWDFEKEPSKIGDVSHDQPVLPSNSSFFGNSLSGQEQVQSWKAPGSSGSSHASQLLSFSQGCVKPMENKVDGVWHQQLDQPSALGTADWGDQGDPGLSLWRTTSTSKTDSGWGDGPWSAKLNCPSSSGWNEASSELYPSAEDKKASSFDLLSETSKQTAPSFLQQLVSLGFHKGDVQAALLSNNLNTNVASSELLSCNNRKPVELNASSSGPKGHGGQGLSGSISIMEESAFGHTGGVMNCTATTESQGQLAAGSMLKSGHQTPSSLVNTPNLQAQQLAYALNAAGQMAPHPVSSQALGRQQQQQQQQVLQNQMLQQLKMAVQSGLASHQPPSHLPSPALLLGLRHLVQLQNVLDWLLIQHQALIQQNRSVGLVQPGQLEQLLVNIQNVKQQIAQQKWKVAQLQKQLPWTTVDQHKDFPKDLTSLQVKEEMFNPWRVAPPAIPPSASFGQSENAIGMPLSLADQIPGSKSRSAPYVTDCTWSFPSLSSHLSNGPASSASLAEHSWATPAAAMESKPSARGDGEGSKVASTAALELTASDSKPTSASTTLDIEEFIPGKLWQGPSGKNDDLYVTPADIPHSVFNSEAQVLSIFGRSSFGSTPNSHLLATGLGMAGSGASQMLKDGVWSMGSPAINQAEKQWMSNSLSKNQLPPPGLQQSFSRGVPWAPGSTYRADPWMSGSASNCLLLKNFPQQVDCAIVKALCQQHGPLQFFRYNSAYRQFIVSYRNKDDAIQAKAALHSCVLANTCLVAEFIGDTEAARLVEQLDMVLPSGSSGSGNIGSAWPIPRVPAVLPKKMETQNWNGFVSCFSDGYRGIWGPAAMATAAGAGENVLPVDADLFGGQ